MARENWTSSIGFILASAGSAIGLGNIWKFPYVAGENGGGTFVLVYVLCVALIGLPVMCAEMLIGRHTRRNVINAMGKIELLSRSRVARWVLVGLSLALAGVLAGEQAWGLCAAALFAAGAFGWKGFAALGWVCTGVALAILSYYAVVGGWIVDYLWRALSGSLCLAGESTAQAALDSGAAFGAYAGNPWRVLVGFVIFMGLTGAVILGGIQAGIERVSKVLMPALFVLLLVVIVRSVTLPGALAGVDFLLRPRVEGFSPRVVLMALGQAFFSLSLGMAITVTYGSYLHREHNVLRAAGWVAALDTLAALLGGMAIFPAVFAAGLSPSGGPGLIFGALPATFSAMPLGNVWAACFFFMLLIAAVTSSASLLECGATVFIERLRSGHRRGSRRRAVLIGFAGCTGLGLLTVFSTVDWAFLPWLQKGVAWATGGLMQGSWFDTLDNFASNWVLPFTALGIALLVGWAWTPRRAAVELLASGEEPRLPRALLAFGHYALPEWAAGRKGFPLVLLALWGVLIRWVAPIGIVLVFLNSTGLLTLPAAAPAPEAPAVEAQP